MNIGQAVLFVFCGALASGIFLGNSDYFKPTKPAPETVKQETKFIMQEIGIVGPCKTYLVKNDPDLFDHAVFTVICPSEYNAAAALLY